MMPSLMTVAVAAMCVAVAHGGMGEFELLGIGVWCLIYWLVCGEIERHDQRSRHCKHVRAYNERERRLHR